MTQDRRVHSHVVNVLPKSSHVKSKTHPTRLRSCCSVIVQTLDRNDLLQRGIHFFYHHSNALIPVDGNPAASRTRGTLSVHADPDALETDLSPTTGASRRHHGVRQSRGLNLRTAVGSKAFERQSPRLYLASSAGLVVTPREVAHL